MKEDLDLQIFPAPSPSLGEKHPSNLQDLQNFRTLLPLLEKNIQRIFPSTPNKGMMGERRMNVLCNGKISSIYRWRGLNGRWRWNGGKRWTTVIKMPAVNEKESMACIGFHSFVPPSYFNFDICYVAHSASLIFILQKTLRTRNFRLLYFYLKENDKFQ